MQKIYFRKLVDLDHKLKELISISVDESINYKMENQGMRAIGSIMISGEFKGEELKKSFHESIDLDILAQLDKIIDKREFHVKVEDFDYSFQEGNLALVIQACIYGVKDDDDRVIEAQPSRVMEENDEDIANEIESLLREDTLNEILEEKIVEDKSIEKKESIIQVNEITSDYKDEDHKSDEKIIEEDEDLGTYYLYVVQDGDSYQSIAAHYQCDEYKLKDYNHDRSLEKGSIVIVPYYHE